MFSKLEISHWRAIFWPIANVVYWGLIFLSWWDTRVKVFFGVSVVQKFLEFRNVASVTRILGELEAEAYSAVAQNGSMAGDFIIIPLIMAVVMFIVPFIVRRDHGGPVSGVVILPAMTVLCYFFASFLNLILVVALSTGIHYLLFKVPGPDICMFMVHPLYLIFPIFRSIPGFASQCLYLAYTATVLSTDSILEYESEEEDEDEYAYEEEELIQGHGDDGDDWDRSACLMEMDRFSRILNTKFDNPLFLENVRQDFASYINVPGQVREELDSGSSHYKIVLTQTGNSLRSILIEDPKKPQARNAYAFIVDEMARMEFISETEAIMMKTSMGINPSVRRIARRVEPQTAERGAYPAKPPEPQADNQRDAGFRTSAAPAEPQAGERFVSYQLKWPDLKEQYTAYQPKWPGAQADVQRDPTQPAEQFETSQAEPLEPREDDQRDAGIQTDTETTEAQPEEQIETDRAIISPETQAEDRQDDETQTETPELEPEQEEELSSYPPQLPEAHDEDQPEDEIKTHAPPEEPQPEPAAGSAEEWPDDFDWPPPSEIS